MNLEQECQKLGHQCLSPIFRGDTCSLEGSTGPKACSRAEVPLYPLRAHPPPDSLDSLPWTAFTFHCPQKLRGIGKREEVNDEAPRVFAYAMTLQR